MSSAIYRPFCYGLKALYAVILSMNLESFIRLCKTDLRTIPINLESNTMPIRNWNKMSDTCHDSVSLVIAQFLRCRYEYRWKNYLTPLELITGSNRLTWPIQMMRFFNRNYSGYGLGQEVKLILRTSPLLKQTGVINPVYKQNGKLRGTRVFCHDVFIHILAIQTFMFTLLLLFWKGPLESRTTGQSWDLWVISYTLP